MTRPSRRVLLIGWDAADWQFIDPLIERGLMPTLASLRARSVWGNLATLQPILSPMLWTSIATGKRPDKHGILGFIEPLPDGSGVRPVASTSRRCKALWNILHQQGLNCNVVGWYASHPAEPIHGTIVSNQFEAPSGPDRDNWPTPPGAVHPQTMEETLRNLRIHPAEVDAHAILPFIPEAAKIDQAKDGRIAKLMNLIAQTASIHAVATHLVENTTWDFTAIYYEGIDRFGHEFMQYHPPKIGAVSDADFELYQHVMTGCYRFHDMLLERLLKLAGPDTTVLLISDHGYHHDAQRPESPDASPETWHRTLGVACLAGPGIKTPGRIYGGTILDVAPTVLSLLGQPAGMDMDGRVWSEVLETAPPKPIPSWEKVAGDAGLHPPETHVSVAGHRESIQQLVELGYLDASALEDSASVVNAEHLNQFNLAAALMDGDRPAEAAKVLRRLHEQFPNSDGMILHLAVSLASAGDKAGARAFGEKLLSANPVPPRTYVLLGTLDLMDGNVELAMQRLAQAEQANPRLPGLHFRIGQVYLQAKRWEEARRAFERALALEPDSAQALDGLAELSLATGANEQAVEHALAAVEIAHFFPRAHFHLAQALHNLGKREAAVAAAELCLKQAPTHVPSREFLVELYELMGQRDLATPHRRHLDARLKIPPEFAR